MRKRLIPVLVLIACVYDCRMEDQDVAAAVDAYAEPHRPQIHFSPPRMWMNDPNGLVYFQGEYHLFYQFHPDSTVWGPMHWAHAVSTDLVHWQHLPIALAPDRLGYIFSGSAVVDWNDTSGFGKAGKPPLVAVFTYHDPAGEKEGRIDFQRQGVAYSNDRGRNWTKYEGNPVLANPGLRDFRDPKVIWHEESRKWVMTLAAGDHVQFYGSPDLKKWTLLSTFGKEWGAHQGVWECPDLFPLAVEGSSEVKWVLLQSINPGAVQGGSGTQYFIGDFDGSRFTLDPEFRKAVSGSAGGAEAERAVWLDYGRDDYAGVTFSDVPDGRRIFIGWMSNWDYAQAVPTDPWRSAMTLPRELSLRQTGQGLRLISRPIRELESLRSAEAVLDPATVSGEMDLSAAVPFSPVQMEVMLEFDLAASDAAEFGLLLSNRLGEEYRLGFSSARGEISSDRTRSGPLDFSTKFAAGRHTAPVPSGSSNLRLHLFFDRASCEVFVNGGERVMTEIFFPRRDFSTLKLFAVDGRARLSSARFYRLEGIWNSSRASREPGPDLTQRRKGAKPQRSEKKGLADRLRRIQNLNVPEMLARDQSTVQFSIRFACDKFFNF